MSVRDVEKLVKNINKPAKPKKAAPAKNIDFIYQDIAEKLKASLGTKVSVLPKEDGSGKIEIEFYSHEELDRILELLP